MHIIAWHKRIGHQSYNVLAKNYINLSTLKRVLWAKTGKHQTKSKWLDGVSPAHVPIQEWRNLHTCLWHWSKVPSFLASQQLWQHSHPRCGWDIPMEFCQLTAHFKNEFKTYSELNCFIMETKRTALNMTYFSHIFCNVWLLSRHIKQSTAKS